MNKKTKMILLLSSFTLVRSVVVTTSTDLRSVFDNNGLASSNDRICESSFGRMGKI
jgi:hypothetical protein